MLLAVFLQLFNKTRIWLNYWSFSLYYRIYLRKGVMIFPYQICDHNSRASTCTYMAMYKNVSFLSWLFNQLKCLIEIFLNPELRIIVNLKINVIRDCVYWVFYFASFRGSDDSLNVQSYDFIKNWVLCKIETLLAVLELEI